AMRVLIWIALWAEALRTVATVAGVWSAGSWGIFATLFVGVLAPAWMFALSPTWLGWRILSRVDLPRVTRPGATAPFRARDALACLAPGGRFPWLARVHGGEALMLAAFRRRDFRAALRHATIGRGRLVRLLVALGDAQTGGRLPRRRLWLRWALAPGRLRTW